MFISESFSLIFKLLKYFYQVYTIKSLTNRVEVRTDYFFPDP